MIAHPSITTRNLSAHRRCRMALGRATRISRPFLGFLLSDGCKFLARPLVMGKVHRVVAPLIIRDQFERPLRVKDRLGHHARPQRSDLVERQGWGLLLPHQPHPDQEMMRQHGQHHVLVPALPIPYLIGIQSDILFALRKRQIHRSAYAQDAGQVRRRRFLRHVTHVVAHVGRIGHVALDN